MFKTANTGCTVDYLDALDSDWSEVWNCPSLRFAAVNLEALVRRVRILVDTKTRPVGYSTQRGNLHRYVRARSIAYAKPRPHWHSRHLNDDSLLYEYFTRQRLVQMMLARCTLQSIRLRYTLVRTRLLSRHK